MSHYIVIFTACFSLFGASMYIKEMIYDSVKPNKISRLIWSIAPLIATAAAISEWALRSALPIFMSGFSPLLIFIVSLFTPQAYWKIEKSDYICWLLSLLALWGRYMTKTPLIATLFAIGSDFLAWLPTYRKARSNPESESFIPYSTGIISSASAFFVLSSWQLTEILRPIYLILFNLSIILTIKRHYIFNKA